MLQKSNQCIILTGVELQDDLTLLDCGITNGSTLKLVLSMRGGPINTRRVAMPPPKQQQPNHAELHSLMMRNKAQILDKTPKNGQVMIEKTSKKSKFQVKLSLGTDAVDVA